MKLSKKQEKRFEKYALFYDLQGEGETDKVKVDRQYYVYKKLLEKSCKNVAVQQLIDLTVEEIRIQYIRKEHFENKTGFLLALWGILLTAIIQNRKLIIAQNQLLGMEFSIVSLKMILSVLIIAIGIIAMFFLCKTLFSTDYMHFDFSDREYNFKCAVEDKALFLIVQLQTMTDVWQLNEDAISDKAKNFDRALFFTIIFGGLIFLAYLIGE